MAMAWRAGGGSKHYIISVFPRLASACLRSLLACLYKKYNVNKDPLSGAKPPDPKTIPDDVLLTEG